MNLIKQIKAKLFNNKSIDEIRLNKEAIQKFNYCIKHLKKDEIAIDCGANIGKFTLSMASSNAIVYAFEPNSYAFNELIKNTKNLDNVICFNKAIGVKDSIIKLYMHENSDKDHIKWSTGSSILPYKKNVNSNIFEKVESINFVDFLRNLSNPVALIKIDIEGGEIDILNKLIDCKYHKKIGEIFVEVHDRKIPELVAPTQALRQRIKREKISNICLDWQ